MFAPRNLQRWVEMVNYSGEDFEGYYIASWRLYKCTSAEKENFRFIQEHLEDCGDDRVICARFSDEIYSGRLYMLVHQDAEKPLRMADMYADRVRRTGKPSDTVVHS